MALSTVTQALAQFNASANWYSSTATAALRLEAVEFLLVNRAVKMTDEGSEIDFESLGTMATQLRAFLGAGTPRANGRSRRVGVSFSPSGGVQ